MLTQTVPAELSKLSTAVNNDLVKETKCDESVIKANPNKTEVFQGSCF